MHFDVQRRLEWHSSRENVHVRRGLSVLSRMCNAERRAAFPQICRCSPRATTAIERIVILFPGKVNNARFHLHGAVSRHIASRRVVAPLRPLALSQSPFRTFATVDMLRNGDAYRARSRDRWKMAAFLGVRIDVATPIISLAPRPERHFGRRALINFNRRSIQSWLSKISTSVCNSSSL